jgi:hypothetical protein
VATFALTILIDDAKAQELYGEPLDSEGLQTALEAALGNLGAEVSEVRDVTEIPAHISTLN